MVYAVMKGTDLSPITLPELSGASAKGYQGHDRIDVVEGCLVRRFPIHKASDSNAKAGEAGWILRPTSVLQF